MSLIPGLLLLTLGGDPGFDDLRPLRQPVDDGSSGASSAGTKPLDGPICGPRRNKEKLAECLAAGESGYEARCAFCRALARGIRGTPLDLLKSLCWKYTMASMQEWSSWCYWAWGGA